MYSSTRSSSFQEEMETATGLPEDVEKLLTCPVCLDVSFILLYITLRYHWLVANCFVEKPFFWKLSSRFPVFWKFSLLAIIHHDVFCNFNHVALTWTCKTLWFALSTVRLVLSGVARVIKISSNWKFNHLILNKPVKNYRTLILRVKISLFQFHLFEIKLWFIIYESWFIPIRKSANLFSRQWAKDDPNWIWGSHP